MAKNDGLDGDNESRPLTTDINTMAVTYGRVLLTHGPIFDPGCSEHRRTPLLDIWGELMMHNSVSRSFPGLTTTLYWEPNKA
jgi:hypothetical protein